MKTLSLKMISWIALTTSTLSALPMFAQNPNVQVKVGSAVISRLTNAMQLVHAGDGSNRIFVAERRGVVKVFMPGQLATPIQFLNMNSSDSLVDASGEGGLLSIAFHPAFATNGFMYVYYTNRLGDLTVARYTAVGNSVNTNTRREILVIPHPIETNHNGGEMHFGKDGYLYLSTGDGGGGNDVSNNAQTLGVLLGKILRINVDVPNNATPAYSIPADNPFPNSPVYALGLRNPFRWSFDRLNGDMWIGDVGQGAYEEINYRSAGTGSGANFGWRCYEGLIETPNVPRTGCLASSAYVAPIYTYPIGAERGRSVIGGVVYRGTKWPDMSGFYIGTDYSSGQFHVIRASTGAADFQESALRGVTDIGEDEAGEIYAVTSSTIYALEAAEGLPVNLIGFSGRHSAEGVKLEWETAMEKAFSGFDVEFSTDARNFRVVGNVVGGNLAYGGKYSFTHSTAQPGQLYYRLKMIDTDQTFRYSKIISVRQEDDMAGNFVRPSLINTHNIRMVLDEPFQYMELVGANGSVLIREEIAGRQGDVTIPLGNTASGIYFVRVTDNDRVVQQKILVNK